MNYTLKNYKVTVLVRICFDFLGKNLQKILLLWAMISSAMNKKHYIVAGGSHWNPMLFPKHLERMLSGLDFCIHK
jgi:hypothetical protein